MNKSDKIIIGIMIVFSILVISTAQTQGIYNSYEFFEIYKATVPFGEFVVSGSLDVSMFLFIGRVGGTIEGEESYLIKYFVGEELRTMNLDADLVPLIIDGSLQLEIISSYRTFRPFYVFEHMRRSNPAVTYKIHIPYLPEVNQTLKDDWSR